MEYGLLQHTFQGIDIDRVQSVVVKQSFIRRLLGYCELSLGKIDAATGEDSSNKQNTLANQGIIIHPFVKMNRVPEILAGLVPEFSDLPQEAKPVAKVALRRAVLRRGSGFAYNEHFMQVSNGGLSRETVSFPRQKIQFGCTKSNPLQRRAGTDTLLATTAAGSGGTTTTLIDASHADAMAWLDWLKPGGNQ